MENTGGFKRGRHVSSETGAKKIKLTCSSVLENENENCWSSPQSIRTVAPPSPRHQSTKNLTLLSQASQGQSCPRTSSSTTRDCFGYNIGNEAANTNDEQTSTHEILPKAAEGQCDNHRLVETSVGILEYVSIKSPCIKGIVKQRYADFMVHERNILGRIVKLTDMSFPNLISDSDQSMKVCTSKPASAGGNLPSSDVLISKTDVEKLEEISESSKEDSQAALTLSEDNDKDHRTLVHMYIKEKFPGLDTTTVTLKNGSKAIQVKPLTEKKKGKNQRVQWPSCRPDYCQFTLYKENKDTMDAINLIARMLHVRPNLFTFAGTKDRRAITTQRICVYRVPAEKLYKLNEKLRNVALGNFTYTKNNLRLGDLSGNHFTIVLRNVENRKEEILASMESLRDKGFVNYFGMQRFGTGSVPTFDIGKAILSCDWASAVDLIMKPREGEPQDLSKARANWFETRDASSSFKLLRQTKSIEGHLLEGLVKHGSTNYCNALQRIPRNTRLMYLHSYQSLTWNQVVSRRIKKFGLQPVIGDLIIDDTANSICGSADTHNEEIAKKVGKCAVRELTEEDIRKETYAITDIVMPLPGFDVSYPGNNIKEWYKDIMSKDGIDIENMKHKVKDYSLSGAYRHIVVKPGHFNWSIIPYDDYQVPVIQTDLDLLNDKPLPTPQTQGKYKALKMEFSLPPSAYATMAIREITKTDSSSHYQSNLSREFLKTEEASEAVFDVKVETE